MTVFVYVPLHPLTFLFPFLGFVLAIKSRVLSHFVSVSVSVFFLFLVKQGVGVNVVSG